LEKVYRPDPVFLKRFAAARLVLIFGMVSLLEQKIDVLQNYQNGLTGRPRSLSIGQKPYFKNRWRERKTCVHAST
jgi:hypothetical protein